MERDNNNMDAENSRIPENDPSKAMDSKREVENSNDEKTDQDFPGYPHYPAKEDIMDQRTGSERVDIDPANLPTGPNKSAVGQRFLAGQDRERAKEAMTPQPGNGDDGLNMSSDKADFNEIGSTLDGRNDEIGIPQNVSNDELSSGSDLPGSDLEEGNDRG
jgi:hypothetical protein